MKRLRFIMFVVALFASCSISAQVAINTDGSGADSSAILDIKSTNKGFLAPRMTLEEIGNITNPANGLMVFNTSDDKVYVYISSGNTWKELNYGTGVIPTSEVGDCLVDGIVFYIFQSSDIGYIPGETHGLIVSLDEGNGEWGCFLTNLNNVADVNSSPSDPETELGARIGDGELNTDGIITDCASGYAADWCRDKGTEWFLPSRGELNKLYNWYATDKPGNNNLIASCGGVGLAGTWYWSSTEISDGAAWDQNFSNGSQGSNGKNDESNVRAIRAF